MKRIKIRDNLNMEITRMQIVCNLYDESGNAIGSPNQVIELASDEAAALGITEYQPIIDKFQQDANAAL